MPIDRSLKKCINPWYKFAAIFIVAALTLFMIFEVDSNRLRINMSSVFHNYSKDDSADFILVTSSGSDPASPVAVQFETCQTFFVFNESTGKYETYSNGPAILDLKVLNDFIVQRGIEAVITGTMEIDTYQMLSSSHVEIFTGVSGTVEEALVMHKKNELVSYSRFYSNQTGTTRGVFQNGSSGALRKEY